MDKKQIVVTGGAGFVGSNLVSELILLGYYVVCVDNLTYGYNSMISQWANYPNFQIETSNLCDNFNSQGWKRIEEHIANASHVVHLACLVGYPACEREKDYATRLNYEVSINLADLCKKHNTKMLYASTGSVYGEIDGICNEESTVNPLTHYAITKLNAEKYMLEHCDALCFRFATAFGLSARLRLDLYINDMVYRALIDGSVVAYEPRHRRTFIYVTDMARLFMHAIDNMNDDHGIYNAGDDNLNLTKMDILEKIREHIPNFFIAYGDYQADKDKRDYSVSYVKLTKTNFECKIHIDQGIKILIEYIKLIDLKQVGFTVYNNIK